MPELIGSDKERGGEAVPHIGFLIFPDLQQLDMAGPYEVFATVARETRIHLVWKTRDLVRSVTGLPFTPTTTLSECPPLDVICVPGGSGVTALLDDFEVLDFLKRQSAGARFVTSVCTGALLLGAAGLLAGRRATTHWASFDLLDLVGATPTEGRVVRDGNLFTAGGVTAGIDFGLTLVAELYGQAEAEAVQLELEYAPAPPFAAGTPRTAPAAVVDRARESNRDTYLRRRDVLRRLRARDAS